MKLLSLPAARVAGLPVCSPTHSLVAAAAAVPAARRPQARRRRAVAAAQEAPAAAAGLSEVQVRMDVTRRIKKLGREGKAREAVAELASMAKLGIQPDTLAATALLDACARNAKMEMAQSVFEELFEGLLAPDEVVFAVLLRGFGTAGERPQWNEISSLLQTMERKHGIAPTTVTFNALLEACTKSNDGERAAEIMSRMQLAGVQPDEFTLEAVRPRRSMRSLLKRNFNVTF
ncbi:Lipoxygenase y domain-containing 1 [Micractinium conductrix]|uniref:Lipoxygenase y domain-containing 1 n=1 Tax=Micractinium conductrix TaxID=554055 RepID=A0A2P6VB11_9CHLO|nr:Lipoxygenase y domain-containing 1 [Micractinium conductrix]|eukprot:PSC71258.1 Lipoxygenase y domain-containing 1 [Micractinium conductrix]